MEELHMQNRSEIVPMSLYDTISSRTRCLYDPSKTRGLLLCDTSQQMVVHSVWGWVACVNTTGKSILLNRQMAIMGQHCHVSHPLHVDGNPNPTIPKHPHICRQLPHFIIRHIHIYPQPLITPIQHYITQYNIHPPYVNFKPLN